MINPVNFSLDYKKFPRTKPISMPSGLNIIYGESGSGKTHLIRSLVNLNTFNNDFFKVVDLNMPESFQIVFQNPENQILSHKLSLELSFGLESSFNDTILLQKKIKKIKSNLTFINDWDRHPSTLSGGEMEMLNLVTAFSMKPELILIDDGLSFMNADIKSTWVKWMKKEITNQKTILWFTSDISDFIFSKSNWLISLSDFVQVKNIEINNNYSFSSRKGNMSLNVENLSFYFDKKTPLIENWNSNINSARSIALAGKNGIGKTTLSQLLAGTLKPSNGSIKILIDGVKPSIALLDQFPERILGPNSLDSFVSLLVKEEKLHPRLVKKCIKQLNSHQINWEIIKNKSALDISWSTLRMSLIIILSHCNYDLLILDEPTFGFGWEQKKVLSKIFLETLKHKHLILISHDMPFVMAHCDQIYDLDKQSIINNKKVLINAN
ncbi:MAG: ATP-binding cassette domain-containing protein [Candidatus Neomarinimicrobiota bacterium]